MLEIKAKKELDNDLERLFQQAEECLRSRRHFGDNLASLPSAGYRGHHQQCAYAVVDESSGDRSHDLGHQDHDLRRQEERKVASTKSELCSVPNTSLGFR